MLQENQKCLKFKMKLKERLKITLEDLKENPLIRKIINPYCDCNNFEYAMEEIRGDIKILNQFKEEHPDYPLIKPDDNLTEYMDNIRKEYSKNYCLVSSFKDFTRNQKMQYMFERIKLNKILEIKDNNYSF